MLSFIFDLYFIYILIWFILYILIFVLKTDLFEVKKIFNKIIKSIIIFSICILIGFWIFNYTSKTLWFWINDNKNINTKTQILNEKIVSISKNSLDLNININDFKKIKDDEYIKSDEFLKLLKGWDCWEKYKDIILKLYKNDKIITPKILELYTEGYYFKYFIIQSNSTWRPKYKEEIYDLNNNIVDKNLNMSCPFCNLEKISPWIFYSSYQSGININDYIKENSYYNITLYLSESWSLNTNWLTFNNVTNNSENYYEDISYMEKLKFITKEYALPIGEDFCENFE